MSRLRESPVRFVVKAQHAERSMAARPDDGYRRIMSTHVMARSALSGEACLAIQASRPGALDTLQNHAVGRLPHVRARVVSLIARNRRVVPKCALESSRKIKTGRYWLSIVLSSDRPEASDSQRFADVNAY
jgi:hypothetical protein